MKFWKLFPPTVFLIFSNSVNAALVERLDGLAYYDTEADLTWLADANYAQTSGYDADGRMTWDEAVTWVDGLTVSGVDGWRLPDSNTCSDTCTDTEMGNLYYNVLGNTGYSFFHTGPFNNIPLGTYTAYWAGSEYSANNQLAWSFYMTYTFNTHGIWLSNSKAYSTYAWAVYDGDVSAVPIPAAAWLFGSGLLSLVGMARRRQHGEV